jgi:hypothetical protein
MYNYVLVDKLTGKIINALQTPNKGVTLKPENNNQKVWEISVEDFDNILSGQFGYYNYITNHFEPEIIRKWVLVTPGPYKVGLVNLVFEQWDLSDRPSLMPVTTIITINGQAQEIFVDDGTLEVELDCPDPSIVKIKIEASRHETLETEVVIGG